MQCYLEHHLSSGHPVCDVVSVEDFDSGVKDARSHRAKGRTKEEAEHNARAWAARWLYEVVGHPDEFKR